MSSLTEYARMKGLNFSRDDDYGSLDEAASTSPVTPDQQSQKRKRGGGEEYHRFPPPHKNRACAHSNHKIKPKGQPAKAFSRAAPSTNFRRHESFWFNDGSLFIQLDGVRFKIHRTRLRRASSFLGRVFDIREAAYIKSFMNISLKSGDFLDVSVKVEEVDGFDLYILDGIHVSLEDFEVLVNLIDGGLEYVYGSGQVPFSVLASAIRAATTFQCPGIRSWAIQSIEEIWNPRRTFLEPLPNASQVLTLARTYHMAETVTDRALYELLRAENFDELRNMHPPFLQKRLDIARGKMHDAWISIAADPDKSSVPCPWGPGLDSEAACISHSPSGIRDNHTKVIHTSLFIDRYMYDPIGGLESLISGEINWSATGYCPGCVQLKTRLWTDKKDKLVLLQTESALRLIYAQFLPHFVLVCFLYAPTQISFAYGIPCINSFTRPRISPYNK
ncbi:hypothetical protein B0H14DRAFT_3129673 [Mycena olivaceomarginata]|nr:hypothetical protein B0H14DRAFT_3129673 [Mycena olivaceomarginata]